MRQYMRLAILAFAMLIPTGMSAGTLKGDANEDGEVTTTDIMVIVNYILHGDATNFNVRNADFNSDGDVNVTDIMAIVNYILYKPVEIGIDITVDGEDSGIYNGGSGDGSDQAANGSTFNAEENK